MAKAAKKPAADKIDVNLAIHHLRQSIVELELVNRAGPNNGTRQNVANAKAYVTAVFGTIQLLEGKALHEPR